MRRSDSPGSLEVKSGCPTTTSAGAPFSVGISFQMRIRLLFWSTTMSRPPATTRSLGSLNVVTVVPEPRLSKSG